MSLVEWLRIAWSNGFQKTKKCQFCLKLHYLLPYEEKYCSESCMDGRKNFANYSIL